MKNLLAYGFAGAAFLKSSLGRQDPLNQRTQAGLSCLDSWDRIPENTALQQAQKKEGERPAPFVLYCHAGPHLGECFFLKQSLTTVGVTAECGMVLTPSSESEAAPFEFKASTDGLELRALAQTSFELNGRPEHHSTLVDFDEITLCGNRFLVLSLNGGAQ